MLRKIILCGLVAAMCAVSVMPMVQAAVSVEKIAESDHQWTGIAISRTGRMFVNFPTWNDYPKDYRVAELVDGRIFFTTSQINYPLEDRQKYGVYRLAIDE